ncbi:MAG: ATP-grasp domain-containing protein [Betaproteobacteria bacterium]
MPRILLLATTTGYQTRAFGEAAERLGVELVFATDRCAVLEDPWRDGAVPIRFHQEAESVEAILRANGRRPLDGVLVVGDRPTVIAARVLQRLGLPGHPPEAVAAARNKLASRERLRAGGLPVPWFAVTPVDADVGTVAASLPYPCVLKPLALSGSRGVMRVDDAAGFRAAFDRLRALLQAPDIRGERDEIHRMALVESFVPGREFAVEGILHHGALQVVAVFDKPDPLDGPFFEETIYVTPTSFPQSTERAIVAAVARAARAIGLRHGPVHAECRVNAEGVHVLEVAARPIGGLCARALRVVADGGKSPAVAYEELLLRHALGEPLAGWAREPMAAGVMMIPIPRRGVLRGVEGDAEARAVPGIEDVRITAKPDQVLVPLPEGASYLGFIFGRGPSPGEVEHALRRAHARLRFAIDPEVQVLRST